MGSHADKSIFSNSALRYFSYDDRKIWDLISHEIKLTSVSGKVSTFIALLSLR